MPLRTIKRGSHFGVLTGMWIFQNITLHRATKSWKPQAKIRLAFHFVERNYSKWGMDQGLLTTMVFTKLWNVFDTSVHNIITHAQYSAWVIKWAPFLRFGVTLVHANLCMRTFITFSVGIRHIGFSPRRCRFFTKIMLFPNLIRC